MRGKGALNRIDAAQRTITLHNRQTTQRLNLRLLRRITRALLRETWPHGGFDLAIYVVAEPEMTRLNETYLHHKGSTDVITFDYAEKAEDCQSPIAKAYSVLRVACCVSDAPRPTPHAPRPTPHALRPTQHASRFTLHVSRFTPFHGEIFICLDEAVSQARRFRTTWQSELVRYVVHGVLHLLGYDDAASRARRRMKKAEDTLLHLLAREFDLYNLGLPS